MLQNKRLSSWCSVNGSIEHVNVPDVGDGIQPSADAQHVGVLGEQRLVDDPPLVLGLLEVRVGEEEEHLLQLPFPEEVGQVLHGVGPQAGDVAVAPARGVLLAQSGDSAVQRVDLVENINMRMWDVQNQQRSAKKQGCPLSHLYSSKHKPVPYVVRHLDPDLQPEHEFGREHGR